MLIVLAVEIGIALALLVGLVLSVDAGFRVGRRSVRTREAPTTAQLGAIQGATLGLLGLFLGFSFAGASGRFMERQDLIVAEANAIGTAYLRADLLDDAHASELRASLAEYVAHRLEVSRRLALGVTREDAARIEDCHVRMWAAARDGAKERPAMTMAILPPVNEVIDLHSTRLAAGKKHLPALVLGLLMVCSALSMGVIGYGCGATGRRNFAMTTSLAVVIATALWTTIDLDSPRAGLIRLSDAPLAALRFDGPGAPDSAGGVPPAR